MKHNYFICSYGGSGSKMLTAYLKNFGNVFHIHSRNPPEYLTKPGTTFKIKKNQYLEWFTETLIPNNELKNYTVIYIYRNPVNAILSRFYNPDHLIHIESDPTIKIEDIITKEKDLYGIEEFFDNYTIHKKKYNIICIKYEDFFDNIENINKILKIKNCPELYPKKIEKKYDNKEKNRMKLEQIYEKLINKMNKFDSIYINKMK